jgi:hypothetical protein
MQGRKELSNYTTAAQFLATESAKMNTDTATKPGTAENTATQPPLTPDAGMAEKHLRKVFAKLGDYRDGFIEIATAPNGDSFAPTRARHFPLTEAGCKDASAYAARQNDKGCNVYYGQCVVSPDAALNKRTTDAGFYAAHTVVLDADTTGQVEATISALQGLVAPVACYSDRHHARTACAMLRAASRALH